MLRWPSIATYDVMQTWASNANQVRLGPWSRSSWRGTYCGANQQRAAPRAVAATASLASVAYPGEVAS